MDPEFIEIVRLDLVAAFAQGCGCMVADPAAVKKVLEDAQVVGWIENHAKDSKTWNTSRHRFTVLHYARVIGQAAAMLAIQDRSANLEIGESHIRSALGGVGNVWPSTP